jgi:hypothetical protein
MSDLVPYMVQLIANGVSGGLRDAGRLQRLVAASAALLANQHVDLTPYVQQLLPAVLTCLVAKRIGVRLCNAPTVQPRCSLHPFAQCFCIAVFL